MGIFGKLVENRIGIKIYNNIYIHTKYRRFWFFRSTCVRGKVEGIRTLIPLTVIFRTCKNSCWTRSLKGLHNSQDTHTHTPSFIVSQSLAENVTINRVTQNYQLVCRTRKNFQKVCLGFNKRTLKGVRFSINFKL